MEFAIILGEFPIMEAGGAIKTSLLDLHFTILTAKKEKNRTPDYSEVLIHDRFFY